jgi:spore coat protein CotF
VDSNKEEFKKITNTNEQLTKYFNESKYEKTSNYEQDKNLMKESANIKNNIPRVYYPKERDV